MQDSPSPFQQLHAGAQLNLAVEQGTEVFCAAGTLELTALHPWIGELALTQLLRTGQTWRAGERTRVALTARVRSSMRVVRAAAA
ncbi:MAG: hypothetical protein V4864_01280 [Pseudomonadota bacterium]